MRYFLKKSNTWFLNKSEHLTFFFKSKFNCKKIISKDLSSEDDPLNKWQVENNAQCI